MREQRGAVQTSRVSEGAIVAWLKEMVRQMHLTWRLLRDGRVPLWTKVIPPAALAYVISPIDILPDFPPRVVNQLDDLAVLLLSVRLFIELAPPDLVYEHLESLGVRTEEWTVLAENGPQRIQQAGSAVVDPGRDTTEP